jgi:uncharacterized protein YndB with AHSA1/START domain
MNAETVSVTRVVDAPAARVWSVLRTGRDVDRILPALVRTCELDGDGPGAKRTCGTAHGDIEETLLTVDDDTRVFRYRIDAQPMMPLRDYVGTVHVADAPGGGAHVLWTSTYELLDAGAATAVAGALRELLASGIEGLGQLAKEVA